MKKALLSLLAVCLLAVSLTACSGGGAEPSTTVNMEQLQKAMLSADPTLAKDITSITSNTGDASTLRAHVDDRLKLFQQYGPDQASRVEKAEIFTKDQYAVLLICDDSDAVKTAFEDFLSSNN